MRIFVFVAAGLACVSQTQSQTVNQLSEQEVSEGWELLFDGESLDAWRGFEMTDMPASWRVVDGTLHFNPDGPVGGDIITREQFANFELRLEWRIEAGGNSGVFFGVSEDAERTYHTGPEMQILDNAGHIDGQNPLTSAGSDYALHAPTADVTRPVGEWNEVRLRVEGNRVEHWLNGTRIVSYQRWTDDWEALVENSKFVQWPGYGLNERGHIGLQDHGDPVWFRNIKVRRLP